VSSVGERQHGDKIMCLWCEEEEYSPLPETHPSSNSSLIQFMFNPSFNFSSINYYYIYLG